MSEFCETRLLSDEPASDDAFGSHARLARLISQMIGSEDGGRAIALIGNYGAGKSTIIRLLRGELLNPHSPGVQTSEVFVFDAWAHQGDPLRRSFLEEFREFLVRVGWIKSEFLQRKINELRQRVSETETRSTPVFTLTGAVVLFSFFFIPLGADIRTDHPWLGTTFMFLPVIATLVAWLLDRPHIRFWERTFYHESRSGVDATQLFELLWKKTHEISKSKSVSAPDPTSVEFRSLFREILRCALASKDQRLVIVMDNLDRLDPDDAMQIFATMRTFFDQSHVQESWDKRLWLIVPFDSLWILRLIRVETGISLAPGSDEQQAVRAASFLDKSFQVKLRVTEPVLSSWRSYLLTLLNTACPRHQDDFERIYLLYDQLAGKAAHKMAPRALKQFVNRVATLHLEWQEEIPFRTMAAFALVESEVSIDSVAKGVLLDARAETLISDTKWRDHFAALYLNVAPAAALEVLIGEDVRKGLSEGNVEFLKTFAHIPGFQSVCERIVGEDSLIWAKESPSTLALAAHAISGIGGRSSIAQHYFQRASEKVSKWELSSEIEGLGLVDILRHYEETERSARLTEALRKFRPPDLGTTDREVKLDQTKWLQAYFAIASWASRDHVKELESAVRVQYPPVEYVSFIANAAEYRDEDRRFIQFLQPSSDRGPIVDQCVKMINESKSVSLAIHGLIKVQGDWAFDRIVDAVVPDLNSAANLEIKRLDALTYTLLYLGHSSRVPKALQQLKELCRQGFILHHASYAPLTGKTLPRLLTAYLCYGPQAVNVGESAQGFARMNEIASRAEEEQYSALLKQTAELYLIYGSPADDLSRWKVDSQLDAFVAAVLSSLFKLKQFKLPWLARAFASDYDYFKRILSPASFEALSGALVDDAQFGDTIRSLGFSMSHVGLYQSMLRNDKEPDAKKELLDFLISGMGAVPEGTWEAQLQEHGAIVDLLIAVSRDAEQQWFPGDALRSAIYSRAVSVADGKSSLSYSQDDWRALLGALRAHHREVLLRDVLNLIIGERPGALALLDLYQDELLDCDILEPKADDIVRHVYVSLVNSANDWALEWIIRSLECPAMLTDANASSTQFFAEQVMAASADKSIGEQKAAGLERIISILKGRGLMPAMSEETAKVGNETHSADGVDSDQSAG